MPDLGKRNKNLLFGAVFVLAIFGSLVLFQATSAQTPTPPPETGFERICPRGDGIAKCVQQIYILALGLGSLVALLMIVLAGYRYMTAAGNAQQVESAKEAFASAFIGLIVIFVAFILLYLINPDLVKFRGLQFPKTTTAPPDGGKSGFGVEDEVYIASRELVTKINLTSAEINPADGSISAVVQGGTLILTPSLISSLPNLVEQSLELYGFDTSTLTFVEYEVNDPSLIPDSLAELMGGDRPSRILVVRGSLYVFNADALHADTTGESVLEAVFAIAQGHFGVSLASLTGGTTGGGTGGTGGTGTSGTGGGGTGTDPNAPLPANYPACQKFLFEALDREGNTAYTPLRIKSISVDSQCTGTVVWQKSLFADGTLRTARTDTFRYAPERTKVSWKTQLAAAGWDVNRFVFLPFFYTAVTKSEGRGDWSYNDHFLYMNACNANANYFGWDNVAGWLQQMRYLGSGCTAGYPISTITATNQTLTKTYNVPESIRDTANEPCTTERYCENTDTGASCGEPTLTAGSNVWVCPSGCRFVEECVESYRPDCWDEFAWEYRNCLENPPADGTCDYSDPVGAIQCGMPGAGEYCLPEYRPPGCIDA